MEKTYTSKSAAIKGMWRWYNAHICSRPLVGDGGMTLQWIDNVHGRTLRAYVDSSNNGYYDNIYLLVTPDIF